MPVRSSKVGSFNAAGSTHTCGLALAKCSQPWLEQKPQYTQALIGRPPLFT